MVMAVGSKKWAFLFFMSSAISFSLTATQTTCKKQEQKRVPAQIEDRRALDSYCAVIAGMSGMTLVHGFWQKEYLETLVGLLGLAVSIGVTWWSGSQAQEAMSGVPVGGFQFGQARAEVDPEKKQAPK